MYVFLIKLSRWRWAPLKKNDFHTLHYIKGNSFHEDILDIKQEDTSKKSIFDRNDEDVITLNRRNQMMSLLNTFLS